MTEHLRENRDDLEQRFLLMGTFAMHARELTADCDAIYCLACRKLKEPAAIPVTVLAAAHEPREDLEAAVVAINERLESVTALPDLECPAQRWVVGLLRSATERAGENG